MTLIPMPRVSLRNGRNQPLQRMYECEDTNTRTLFIMSMRRLLACTTVTCCGVCDILFFGKGQNYLRLASDKFVMWKFHYIYCNFGQGKSFRTSNKHHILQTYFGNGKSLWKEKKYKRRGNTREWHKAGARYPQEFPGTLLSMKTTPKVRGFKLCLLRRRLNKELI